MPSHRAKPGLDAFSLTPLLEAVVQELRPFVANQVPRRPAGNVYQQATFSPWTDLAPYVDELNTRRRVTVVRDL